ncbi:hypothetical protein AX17_007168, partial [Amanita inopinata Kibby_2008]
MTTLSDTGMRLEVFIGERENESGSGSGNGNGNGRDEGREDGEWEQAEDGENWEVLDPETSGSTANGSESETAPSSSSDGHEGVHIYNSGRRGTNITNHFHLYHTDSYETGPDGQQKFKRTERSTGRVMTHDPSDPLPPGWDQATGAGMFHTGSGTQIINGVVYGRGQQSSQPFHPMVYNTGTGSTYTHYNDGEFGFVTNIIRGAMGSAGMENVVINNFGSGAGGTSNRGRRGRSRPTPASASASASTPTPGFSKKDVDQVIATTANGSIRIAYDDEDAFGSLGGWKQHSRRRGHNIGFDSSIFSGGGMFGGAQGVFIGDGVVFN